MFGDALRRIVLLLSFAAALICLLVNLFVIRNDIMYSAFISLCVMFAVGIVLFLAASAVAKVLIVFLMDKKKQKEKEAAEAAEAEAKKAGTVKKTR